MYVKDVVQPEETNRWKSINIHTHTHTNTHTHTHTHTHAHTEHSSNLNIKIVHNSIEHFKWNPSDLSSDDVLSCLIVFTNSCFSGTPSENSQVGWDLTNRMARVIGLTWNESFPWEVMPEVFKCSVQEMRHYLISQTKHLNTSGITSPRKDTFHIKPITPGHPIPKVSTHLTIFWWGIYLKNRVCENNQTREDIIKREIR